MGALDPGPSAMAAELSGAVGDLSRKTFLDATIEALSRLIPADATTWNAVDVDRGAVEVYGDAAGIDWLTSGAADVLGDVADEHPMVASYLEPTTYAQGVPRRMSDIVSTSELRRTRVYGELLHPFGAEYQLTVLTGVTQASADSGGRGRCWTLNRSGRDFTRDERDLATRLQPMLVALDLACALVETRHPDPVSTVEADQARQGALDRLGLTRREVEVLALLGRGLTARASARVMRVAPGTVRKHLENCYRKLDVHDRLVAVDTARRLGLIPSGAGGSDLRGEAGVEDPEV